MDANEVAHVDLFRALYALGAMVILIAGWVISHQIGCARRWQQFMERQNTFMREHGALLAQVHVLMKAAHLDGKADREE